MGCNEQERSYRVVTGKVNPPLSCVFVSMLLDLGEFLVRVGAKHLNDHL
jgi:hypothetical protein